MRRRKRNNAKNDDDNGFAEWGGYMAAKKTKLLEQFSDGAKEEPNKKSNLFKGVSIFVNGYTNPTAEELKQIMSLHGGVYHTYHMPAKTKYIIASNLPDVKVKQLGSTDRIVKPEWISDCLKFERLLDYRKYLLYTNRNRKQPRLHFEPIEKENKTNCSETSKEEKKDNSGHISPELFPDFDDSDKEDGKENKPKMESDYNKDKEGVQNKSIMEDHIKMEDSKSNLITAEIKREQDISNVKNMKENESINKTIDVSKDKSNRTKTAVDPKFLSEFYNNSRLHHIATLGATFKQYVCNLREQFTGVFPEREKFIQYLKTVEKDACKNYHTKSSKHSVIMHIDMDCFFVSVGLRKRPELRGLPVAVTHSKGGQEPLARTGVDRQAELDCYKQRMQDKFKTKGANRGPENVFMRLEKNGNQSMSEVASCSYEARKAGVKNGMLMGTALQLCPNLRTIPYDFDEYKEVAYTLYNTISEYTLNIEGVSCDEMFVDITDLLEKTNASVDDWATYIRSLIQNRTGCPCSAGFGSNRLQARMATRTAKPNGQFYLKPMDVQEYMFNIKVDDLPGVGRSTSYKLSSMGIQTCGDLQDLNRGKLQLEFGAKVGETLYNHCRGIDDKPLVYEHERKSVSAEVNYGIRFTNNTEAETFLKQLATEVHDRLSEVRMKGKCITLKLMVRSKDAPMESSKYMGHGVCDCINKSTTFASAVNDLDIITKEVLLLAQKLAIQPTELRGIGIQISRLEKIKKSGSTALTKFLTAANTTTATIKDEKSPTSNSNIKLEDTDISISKNNITSNDNGCFKKPAIIESLTKMPIKIQNNTLAENITAEPVNPNDEMLNNKKNIEPLEIKNKSVVQNGSITKRGRPKGSKSNRTITRKNSNNGSLDKFLGASDTKEQPALPPEIDMEVLCELPEDIRKEIIQQYKIKDPKEKLNTNTEDGLKTNYKNDSILKNDVKTVQKRDNADDKNDGFVFAAMNIEEMKALFANWISSQSKPEPCDIKILGEYLRRLAAMKKIEELYMMMKFLYSEILFKKDCTWHKIYFEIGNIAQEGMIANYGTSILISKNFNCPKNCHIPKR